MKMDASDPKGLVREAYAIEGITAPECRSIFLDWALSVPTDARTDELIGNLLVRYAEANPDHPMTATLRAGLGPAVVPRRRGGSDGRRRI